MNNDTPRNSHSSVATASTALFVLVFVVVLAVYVRSSITSNSDSRWTIYTTMSLLREGNTDIDEYAELVRPDWAYSIVEHGGHIYNRYPLGPSLIALPVIATTDIFSRNVLALDINNVFVTRGTAKMERFVASLLTGLAVVLFLAIARRSLDWWWALALTAVFAFGTPLYSTASRAMWSHTPSLVALTACLYLLVRSVDRPTLLGAVGLLLALAYVMRPTNSVPAAIFALYVLFSHPRQLPRFVMGATLILVPFWIHNLLLFDSLLPPYYRPKDPSLTLAFPEALLGNLFSPGRGLIVYSPVLLFAFYGFWLKLRRSRLLSDSSLDIAVFTVICCHWIAIALFNQDCWWAGHSYGPRLFSDVIPLICYLIIPALQQRNSSRQSRILFTCTFAFLALISIAIHTYGSNKFAPWRWNVEPTNIDEDPARIWDWSDPPFLRGD